MVKRKGKNNDLQNTAQQTKPPPPLENRGRTRVLRNGYPIWSYCRVHIFNRAISDQPTEYLGNNPSTRQKLLFDWSVYLTVLHMIGRSKINERLHDMTLKEDVARCDCIATEK